MSLDSVLQYCCDRCGLSVIPETGELPDGWLNVGLDDYCESCRLDHE